MKFVANLIVCIVIFKVGSGLRIYFNLHESGGLFPKVIQVIVECEENNQNVTAQDTELADNIRRRKKPIILNYGKLFITDVKVNSTGRYRCKLVSPVPHIYHTEVKTRAKRELKASVPAEFGQCRPGYRLVSYDRCFPCHPGTYSSGTSSQCSQCPKNYYAPLPAQDSCYACPKGSITYSEGADNEDACIYVDDKGQPLPAISTKTIVIISCGAIFVVTVIIALIVWYFWLRKRTEPTKPKKLRKKRKGRPEIKRIFDQSPLFMRGSEPFYKQASNSDEHIYAEIGDRSDDSDPYLEPIKPGKKTAYVDDSDSHIYEEPVQLKPVSASRGSLYYERPNHIPHDRTKTHCWKQKEDSVHFDHGRKLVMAPNELNLIVLDARRARKSKPNEEKYVHKNKRDHPVDLHGAEFANERQPISQNLKSPSNIEKHAEIFTHSQRKGSKREAEEAVRLMRKVFEEAKRSVDLKKGLTSGNSLNTVSDTSSASEGSLINLESATRQTNQKYQPDLNEGKDGNQDTSDDKTVVVTPDMPDLPEVIDSENLIRNI